MAAFHITSLQDQIPPPLWSKLQQSPLSPKVGTAIAEIAEIYRLSGVPFFREYTDHSFQHSIEVFKTACELFAEDAIEVLSPDDLIFLLLASALHDSGLHVTEDVFLALTEQTNSVVATPVFDDKPWPELWNSFIAEAKRFSAKKIISLFGDSQPVQEPPRSAIDLSQRDRLLIGEFIRRHHPRYAHEFSLGTIPSASGRRLRPLRHFDDAARDVVGLIARSHGMSLRSTFNYLQSRYDIRDFNRLHIIYVMVALRIADYLQIQPARAPVLFDQIHKIRSPYSSGEWRVHQSIENITTSSLDPEAIFIAANPQSTHDFLKIERWFADFQRELDLSWAILGEVYGRFSQERFDKLRLKTRRIRSNIEDKVELQQRVKYVPDLIKFSVAEPELLKLLMGPLYGDNPLYGLRELTQNAVDSVRELEQLLKTGLLLDSDRGNAVADIEISLFEVAPWTFSICDRGTGMTLDIIKNYFLRAGASFRTSELWKKEFIDEAGKSTVARTGRFGVGALSAFLIGEQLKVYTRHYSDKSGFGFSFETKIDNEEIEVVTQRGPVGTSITVESDKDRINLIKEYIASKHESRSFYYILAKPSVTVKLMDQTKSTKLYSSKERKASSKWVDVPSVRYESVTWDRASYENTGYLYCNGLLIGDIAKPASNLIISGHDGGIFSLNAPTISLVDNNGLLPVDLARKGLSRAEKELSSSILRSIVEEFVAFLFQIEAESPSEIIELWNKRRHRFQSSYHQPFLFGSEGFCIMDKWLLHCINPSRLIVEVAGASIVETQQRHKVLDEKTLTVIRGYGHGAEGSRSATVDALRDIWGPWDVNSLFERRYMVLRKDTFEDVFKLKSLPNYFHNMRNAGRTVEIKGDKYVIVSRSSPLNASFVKEIGNLIMKTTVISDKSWRLRGDIRIFEGYHKTAFPSKTIFSEVWEESFSSVCLPYDAKQRAKLLRENAPLKAHL